MFMFINPYSLESYLLISLFGCLFFKPPLTSFKIGEYADYGPVFAPFTPSMFIFEDLSSYIVALILDEMSREL